MSKPKRPAEIRFQKRVEREVGTRGGKRIKKTIVINRKEDIVYPYIVFSQSGKVTAEYVLVNYGGLKVGCNIVSMLNMEENLDLNFC